MTPVGPSRFVADLGNSRLKWAEVRPDGGLAATVAVPVDDLDAWASAWDAIDARPGGSRAGRWAVASVNPPAAERFGRFLAGRGVDQVAWFRSAADVPIRHRLERPDATGADRALAVRAALALRPLGRPALVVLCGTAITVERVDADGLWHGGAIAPGLATAADALHRLTAQLPRIALPTDPAAVPPAWGRSTIPALEAGLFWGAVGTVRELLRRQADGLGPDPWLAWTGGDADRLAPQVDWPGAAVLPDLVLAGLALSIAGEAR